MCISKWRRACMSCLVRSLPLFFAQARLGICACSMPMRIRGLGSPRKRTASSGSGFLLYTFWKLEKQLLLILRFHAGKILFLSSHGI
jgi:hypothetical protein